VEPIISHKLILRHPNDTKLTISSVHISIETSRIFLGTRTGDLAIYSLPTITALSTTSSIDADSFYPSLHSPDALTSLSLSPTSPNTLFTTSFSGVFAVYDLSGDTPIPTHILQSPNLTNISGLSHPGPTLHGFSGTKFLTFCTRTQSTPLTFPCGGAHRAWCFNPQSQTFVWTQASRLNVFRAARPRTVVAKAGYHGREIKTAAYTKCGGGILATGAEDTTIRITRIGDGKAGIEQNPSDGGGGAVVKRHTTGVLHLLWSSDGTRLFSSGGVEELFVFRITATEALGVIEESVCPVPNSSAEVRICGFDIVEDNGGFVVVVAMSDSCLRVWRYTPPATPGTAGLWIILQEGLYTTCCLLSVKTLRYADGGLGALISATDGCLTLYRLDTLMSQFEPCPLGQWIWRHRVHQSSIKSLDVAIEETNAATEMHIYTGGDDCAIAHTIVLVTDNGQKATTKKSTIIPCAHAAAVTAVAALKNSTTILTAGTDQKVKLWQVGQDEITSIGKRAGESGVADISGAAVVNDEVVVIVGMGVEFWRVK
jgi:WD40 repeat protein